MLQFIQYIFLDLKNPFHFKLVYFFEKIIKYPVVIINRYFKMNFPLPYLLKKDFVIHNSDGKWLIKARSWDDYSIAVPNEQDLREYFFELESWIFLDIWSHIWKWPITLSGKNTHITSYCFEPNPTTFTYLTESVKLNKLEDRMFCYNVWIGNESWVLNFEAHSQSAFSKFIEAPIEWSLKVEVIQIDDFIRNENVPFDQIKLIKIDTEWFEFKVIEWMKNLLQNSSENLKIICEILPVQKDKDAIIEYLSSFWFQYKILETKQDYYFYKKK